MNCGVVHFRSGMGSVEFPSLTELYEMHPLSRTF